VASFLLIHGAWHGGWCFDRLRRPLEAMGHSTAAPTLPGMGGGARALAGASLRSWAGFVVAEAGKLSGPVILCGHSRGGLVISQAAEQAPELFCDLVYISGALVPSGKSLYEVIGAGKDGLGIAFAPERSADIFYNRCTPEDQAMAAARLQVEPVRPLGTALELSDARYGRIPRHYVECADDQCFPLAAQRAMQAALPCASVVMLDSDHSPFLCAPQALAAALDNIAKERMA